MKQYTNESQTAKLIELGFEKPNEIYLSYFDSPNDFKSTNVIEIDEDGDEIVLDNYSIGELVELWPRRIYRDYNYYKPSIFSTSQGWHVVYADFGDGFMWIIKHDTYSTELIDAIFEMLIELKEEGVI